MKKKLFLMTGLISLMVLSSCGTKGTSAISEEKDVLNTKLDALNLTKDEYLDFVGKMNSFSATLSENFFKKNGEAIMSPLSIYMSLSTEALTTKGDTKASILNALGMEESDIEKYTYALYSLSNQEKNKCAVSLSNSMWLSDSLDFKEDVISSLNQKYNIGFYSADFTGNKTRKEIQKYIRKKTNNLLNMDIEYSEDTAYILLNTLYAKDSWTDGPLDYDRESHTYTDSTGKTTDVKLLSGSHSFGVPYETEDYSCFYQTTKSGLKMTFILPEDGKSVYDIMNAENLEEILSLSDEDYTENATRDGCTFFTNVLFPEFEEDFDDSINDVLSSLGLDSLFQASRDYTVFDGEALVSNVEHAAKLKVTEDGFEAAAATSVSMSTACMGMINQSFVIDKSFGYIISDSYGVPLFAGIKDKLS